MFATTKAAAVVRGWGHFEWVGEVVEFPLVEGGGGRGGGGCPEVGVEAHTPGEWKEEGLREEDGNVEANEKGQEEEEKGQARKGETIDWRAITHPSNTSTPLPPWLGISRLVEERRHDIVGTRLHSAIMIVFDLSSGQDQHQQHAESLIYTPHGIPSTSSIISLLSPPESKSLQHQNASQPTLSPPITPLLLLHGLHAVTISGARINLGGHNGAALARSLGVKYWIRTHDEVKDGRGLVGWLLKRRRVRWDEALGLESGKEHGKALVEQGKQTAEDESEESRETVCQEGRAEEQWDRGEDADGVVLTRKDSDEEKVVFFDIGNGECRVLT